jgi:hypothetical protein
VLLGADLDSGPHTCMLARACMVVIRAGSGPSALAGVLAGEVGLGQHRAREGMQQVVARAGTLGQSLGNDH